jgi:hypothetical protein
MAGNVSSFGVHAGNRAEQRQIETIQRVRGGRYFSQEPVDSPRSAVGNNQRATRRAMEARMNTYNQIKSR